MMYVFKFDIKKNFPFVLLFILILTGLYLRLSGISTNHSFWSDEAHVANVARDLIQGDKSYLESIQTLGVNYQPLHLLVVYFSFLLIGTTEFAARLPTVLFNTSGILFAYLLANKLSGFRAGIIASFLMTFSQLNLANATQAKPYAILQVLFLMMLYLLLLLQERPNSKKIHAYLVSIIIVSALFHYVGILFVIPYFTVFICQYKPMILRYLRSPLKIIISILIISVFGFVLNIPSMIHYLFAEVDGKVLFIYNNTTYLRELFAHQYMYISLPALFGFIYLILKKNVITIAVFVWIIALLVLWNFRYYSHNIRYLVPLFGVMFIYFSIFWDKVMGILFNKNSIILTFLLIIFLFIGGSKIIRKPNLYYSPNADFFADVQNANYKNAFQWIKNNIPNYEDLPILNDLYETQNWYLGIAPIATFVKDYTFNIEPGGNSVHSITKNPVHTNLNSFLEFKESRSSGILIVEDWESILPEDIKQYAKQNMKREYRVENLEVSPTDKWPIEIYSWGME